MPTPIKCSFRLGPSISKLEFCRPIKIAVIIFALNFRRFVCQLLCEIDVVLELIVVAYRLSASPRAPGTVNGGLKLQRLAGQKYSV